MVTYERYTSVGPPSEAGCNHQRDEKNSPVWGKRKKERLRQNLKKEIGEVGKKVRVVSG